MDQPFKRKVRNSSDFLGRWKNSILLFVIPILFCGISVCLESLVHFDNPNVWVVIYWPLLLASLIPSFIANPIERKPHRYFWGVAYFLIMIPLMFGLTMLYAMWLHGV